MEDKREDGGVGVKGEAGRMLKKVDDLFGGGGKWRSDHFILLSNSPDSY